MLDWLYRWADAVRDRARRRQGNDAHALGARGEDLAHRYLQKEGLTVVARNWRREEGGVELDIVAWDGPPDTGALVVVEVKSRSTEDFGAPDRAIGEEKIASLRRAAFSFARRAGVPRERLRFDVVNVVFETPVRITHFRDVFAVHQ
jgi:putative endonuclease